MNGKYENEFRIISEAGDAKSKAMDAIKMIQAFDFEAGQKLINEAEKSVTNAHKIQLELIQKEISDEEKVEVNVLTVHSQDHFVMATVAIDMAKTILKLYQQLNEMKGGKE